MLESLTELDITIRNMIELKVFKFTYLFVHFPHLQLQSSLGGLLIRSFSVRQFTSICNVQLH